MAPLALNNPQATIYVPNGEEPDQALARVTHLGVGAHQDDLEIMAFHGIKSCFSDPRRGFAGIICTNGEGSPQTEGPTTLSKEEIIKARQKEQEDAARLGKYSLIAQLGYGSREIRGNRSKDLVDDLFELIKRTQVQSAYIHNLADKHETHVAVAIASIMAFRQVDKSKRPVKLYGCEVWRDLDWLDDGAKVLLDVGGNIPLAEQLIKVYKSQINGGKRYDQAVLGRARSNATFFQSHSVDHLEQLWYAMDLTPLIQADSIDIVDFITSHINHFRHDVENKIKESLTLFSRGEK